MISLGVSTPPFGRIDLQREWESEGWDRTILGRERAGDTPGWAAHMNVFYCLLFVLLLFVLLCSYSSCLRMWFLSSVVGLDVGNSFGSFFSAASWERLARQSWVQFMQNPLQCLMVHKGVGSMIGMVFAYLWDQTLHLVFDFLTNNTGEAVCDMCCGGRSPRNCSFMNVM